MCPNSKEEESSAGVVKGRGVIRGTGQIGVVIKECSQGARSSGVLKNEDHRRGNQGGGAIRGCGQRGGIIIKSET